jgi:hypothetical protein
MLCYTWILAAIGRIGVITSQDNERRGGETGTMVAQFQQLLARLKDMPPEVPIQPELKQQRQAHDKKIRHVVGGSLSLVSPLPRHGSEV